MIATCPVCKTGSLAEHTPEPNLRASQCSKCTGVWIGALHYEEWLKQHGENLPEKAPEAGIALTSGEKPGAKFCPECNFVLMKYKIGHDIGFSLNRCGQCAGIWFDQNEWEIMKSRNLHDDVHLVFSQGWQAAIRGDDHQAAMDEIWREQIGPSDFTEIRRIKAWLSKHPKQAELYAYLMSGREDKEKSERSPAGSTTSR